MCKLIKSGEHTSYLEQEFIYRDGLPVEEFMRDYQAFSLLRKYDKLATQLDRVQVALDGFMKSERDCHEVNTRLLRLGSNVGENPPWLHTVILRVKKNILDCLGSFSWDEAIPFCAFGPGASVGVARRNRHPYYKFGLLRPTVTGECATVAWEFIKAHPHWIKTIAPDTSGKLEDHLQVVSGSRITTVPKSAKTDRVIAIEPLLNMFFQKGIGGVIRRRLRGVGINLDDQTRNQQYAGRASSENWATIDLSSASDCISRELVELFIPDDWLMALKRCRSKFTTLTSGETHFLQKFSSMGNGYTFELESLIFWALSKACLELCGESSRNLCVYGDDIIVPSHAALLLVEVLGYFGFKTNVSKSFFFGDFRESCGKHYYRGCDVTPIYIRKDVVGPERIFHFANEVRRFSNRLMHGYACCSSLKGIYDYVVGFLPLDLRRLSIPEGYGDGGLVRDFDEARPRRHRFYDAFVTRHLVRDYHSFPPTGLPALNLSLFNLERRKKSVQAVPPRLLLQQRKLHLGIPAGVKPFEIPLERYKHKVVNLVLPRWGGLGPWV
jgi:hypothetical protein